MLAIRADSHQGQLQPTHSFFEVGPENIILTALKKAEDGDEIIIRLYEVNGVDTTLELRAPAKIERIIETNILELENLAELRGSIPVRRYEIKTLKIEAQPFITEKTILRS